MSSHNPFQGWPEELLKSYKELPLPTLYDFALAEEKLSLEIRKQNKELKAATEEIASFSKELSLLTKERDSIPLSSEEKTRDQKALMDAFDTLFIFKEQIEKSLEGTSALFGGKTGQRKKKQSDYSKKMFQVLSSFSEGLERVLDKFLISLTELGLEPFWPKTGHLFSPLEHRAVLQVQGGPSGTIYKTIRIGYRSHKEILRYADVIIYQNHSSKSNL